MRIVLCLSMCLFLISLGAVSVTFRNTDFLMDWGPAWMFNLNPDPQANVAFNEGVTNTNPAHVYGRLSYTMDSYEYDGAWGPMSSPASTSMLWAHESFPPLQNVQTPDASYIFVCGDRDTGQEFKLCSYSHINTLNADNNWKTWGAAGDKRIYGGATMYIVDFNSFSIPLILDNCYISSTTSYAEPYGSGDGIIGHGWGTINTAGSDPAWVSSFNNPTGQLEFTFASSSAVVQYYYGLYNSDIILRKPKYKRTAVFAEDLRAVSGQNILDRIEEIGAKLVVHTGDYYYIPNSYIDYNCTIVKHHSSVSGTFPTGIVDVYDGAFWEVGNSFDTSQATIEFSLNNISGISTPANLRILHRKNGYGQTWENTSAVLINNNPLTFSLTGTQIMGQYCLASTGGNNLGITYPRNVQINRNDDTGQVNITWNSVTGALFYNVYSSSDPSSPEEEWIQEAHLAHPITFWNTTATAVKKFYHVKAEK